MKKIITCSLVCIIMSMLMSCSVKEKNTMKDDITPTEEVQPTAAPTSVPTATPTPEPTPIPEEDYTGKKLVALSFDDGPTLETTPLVLDKLEANGVVASFFLIGKNITDETKPLMERELDLGCEINNHSWNHLSMSSMTPEEIKEEIKLTNDKIFETVGVTPVFFRPPYISTSNVMYENIDLSFINGINCSDWEASVTAEKRVETILANVKDGDIILLHDFANNTNTVDALDGIIQGLKDDGYVFVTIGKLFELKGIDPNVENKLWSNPAW
ncbi:MAG TPA: polysaccharide deacetylase family protein [Mobilitalea sp.]|nr:polysaccharide deacetylase family protein [Mobilitalea sp.]